MQATLAAVVSLDGKITRGDDPNVHAWSSNEDWQHFMQLRARHQVVVLDRTTYEAVKPMPEKGLLRVVLTNHPQLYQDVPGQLEFITATPERFMRALEKRGYKSVLLAGGSTMSNDFLRAGLVRDLYLTFEPFLFGGGTPLLSAKPLNVSLQLQKITQLNQRGTLLAHYTVR